MPNLLSDPGKQVATLFTFSWADQVARYTDWTDAIVIGDDAWLSAPEIGVDKVAMDGGTEPKITNLTMPVELPPADTLTETHVHAATDVLIQELVPGSAGSPRYLLKGRVQLAARSIDPRRRVARLELADVKWALRGQLGMPVLQNCIWALGDRGCQKDLSGLLEEAEIVTIEGDRIVLDGLTTTDVEGYWFRGRVTLNGAAVGIRRYTTGSEMWLRGFPPASWLNATVTLTPGCDQQPKTCAERWDNLSRICPLGFAATPNHPVIDASIFAVRG